MTIPLRRPAAASRAALAIAAIAGWVGVAAVLVPGCASLREHTYPPDFNYIPKERLQSTMWQLADRMGELDRRMRATDAASRPSQEEVVGMLEDMERISRALGPGGWPSNHPRVSQNVEAFRSDLAAARREAARHPPNYFLAGRLSGACLRCHEGGP
jgi:outer membrane murein-binding lipoprotein Lpp